MGFRAGRGRRWGFASPSAALHAARRVGAALLQPARLPGAPVSTSMAWIRCLLGSAKYSVLPSWDVAEPYGGSAWDFVTPSGRERRKLSSYSTAAAPSNNPAFPQLRRPSGMCHAVTPVVPAMADERSVRAVSVPKALQRGSRRN